MANDLAPDSPRLFYLDWLRVIAFGLLVFYHTGLIFVDWGFHIRVWRKKAWDFYEAAIGAPVHSLGFRDGCGNPSAGLL
jgi:hypothetical protein